MLQMVHAKRTTRHDNVGMQNEKHQIVSINQWGRHNSLTQSYCDVEGK